MQLCALFRFQKVRLQVYANCDLSGVPSVPARPTTRTALQSTAIHGNQQAKWLHPLRTTAQKLRRKRSNRRLFVLLRSISKNRLSLRIRNIGNRR
jgi:hypothetical protein